MAQMSQCHLEPGVLINRAPVGLSLGNKSHVLANLFVLDDVSIWNQSIDIDPDGTDDPVSSRTRSPHKPSTSRSVTGQLKRPDPGGQFKVPGDNYSGEYLCHIP